MKVPEGRPTMAHRFNGGLGCRSDVESRRDNRRAMPAREAFFRPSGACSIFDRQPTVRTVGFSLSPRPGLERAGRDALVGLVERVRAAQVGRVTQAGLFLATLGRCPFGASRHPKAAPGAR